MPHLYRQERERPTPVLRRLSRTQAEIWRLIDQRPSQPLVNKRGKAVIPAQD